MSLRSMLENLKFAGDLVRPGMRLRPRPVPRSRPGIESLESRSLLSTFTVVNTLDTPPNSSYIPPGSLRDAVTRVNADTQPGVDTINFAIGSGAKTIKLGYYSLPAIKHSVVIDGTSQPGFVGTPIIELDGTTAFYGGGYGLDLIGGNSTVKGLVINRFRNDGILIAGPKGGDIIEGNYIGTDTTGTVALGNGGFGVDVHYMCPNNTIGGTAVAARNLISGNGGKWGDAGVLLNSSGNIVEGKSIGTDVAGAQALGNHGAGVTVVGFTGNTIGGTTPGAGNIIAYNAGDGVMVNTGTGNPIRQNSIFANGGLGIDLQSAANNSQPSPVLISAVSSGGSIAIGGTLTSAANTTYILEFFSNPSGTSQGKTFLGFITVSTDATGKAKFTATFATALARGQVITATATDALGNTSKFSSGQLVI